MKKVAVIGTGPAGISAAYALAKAGFKVTVFEKASTIGGKVTSHFADGRSFEHGIHGWWNNYLNFTHLIKDSGIREENIFKKVLGSNMVKVDGTRYSLKILKWPIPSPLFLLWQAVTAPYLTLKDCFSLFKFAIILFAFRQDKDYEKYDKLSFQELMDECKVSKTWQKLVLEPFILSFDFTIPSRVSAACGLSGMHFYVIRDQLSVCTRWLKGTPTDLIFNPIREKLENEFDVAFYTGIKVERLLMSEDKQQVVGLIATSDGFQSSEENLLVEVPLTLLPAQGYKKLDGYDIMIGRTADEILAFSSTCSHNGCSVIWNKVESLFECPCHAGKYHVDGSVHSGPPPRPLIRFNTVINGDMFEIRSKQINRDFYFDEIVIATDVVNAKNILINSLPTTHVINQNLAKLDTTPVIVIRIWFKGTNYEPTIDSALTPEFNFIDNYFNLNSFTGKYDSEGHLIEVQAYRVFKDLEKSAEELLDLALADLRIINIKYERSSVLSYNVNKHKGLFTRYAPQLNMYRPTEQSGISSLYFSGDWTGFDYPIWMMERGVTSGIRAANAVSRKHGAQEYPLIRLDKGTLLFQLTTKTARLLRHWQEFKFLRFWHNFGNLKASPTPQITTRKKDLDGLYFPKASESSWHTHLVFLLETAAEIEHALMVQYLYTGYSIIPVFGSPEFELVTSWKATILSIAIEEMGHLLTVQSVLKLLGANTNFEREDYPFRSAYYPFPFELLPFNKKTLSKFIIAELPDIELTDELKEIIKLADITLHQNQINNVGLLYEDIINIVQDESRIQSKDLVKDISPSALYRYWKFSKNLISQQAIDRKSAITILQAIAEQGEGMQTHDDSHFERFMEIYRAYDTIDVKRRKQIAAKARPNPTLIAGINQITENRASLWATLHNSKYRLTLNLLDHVLNMKGDLEYQERAQKDMLTLIHHEMSGVNGVGGIKQLSEKIFSLPSAAGEKFSFRAGPPFTLPHILLPDTEEARWKLYIEIGQEHIFLIKELMKEPTEKKEAAACLSRVDQLLFIAEGYLNEILCRPTRLL